jgi:4'-phosphopantetheinyl transferase EntD
MIEIFQPQFKLSTTMISLRSPSPRKAMEGEKRTVESLRELKTLEFATGRRVAEEALIQAGWSSESNASASGPSASLIRPAVGKFPDRSPEWPPGFVGSITHSDHWIWVVASKDLNFLAVGVDTEVLVNSDRAQRLCPMIGLSDEWAVLRDAGFTEPQAFTVLFSAKEAIYKMWYPLMKTHWDFKEIVLECVECEGRDTSHPRGYYGRLLFRTMAKSATNIRQALETRNVAWRNSSNLMTANFQLDSSDVFALAALGIPREPT